MTTRVKFCGITRIEDALHAVSLEVNALGFVFFEQSPRYVDIQTASRLVAQLPPFVTKVGLFLNTKTEVIENVLRYVPLDILQFHGTETEAQCLQFNKPYIKAVPMSEGSDVERLISSHAHVSAFLFDSHVAGAAGGTGRVFDWQSVPVACRKPVILAGGLNPDNVGEAIRTVRPYAVDVSSGIESSKGIKDAAKMEYFIKEVRRADSC